MSMSFQPTLPAILLSACLALVVSPAGGQEAALRQNSGRVLTELLGEEFLAENVRSIRRRAAELSAVDRFEFLARWVLPGQEHSGFRMTGEFTQTDPSPLAVSLEPKFQQGSASVDDSQTDRGRGGQVVSPVLDLLDVAAELGRLDDLRQRIEGLGPFDDEFHRRAKAALLLLVNLELGDQKAALKPADTLYRLVEHSSPQGVTAMWPETLVVYRGIHRFAPNPAVADLLTNIYSNRTGRFTPENIDYWHCHIAALMARYRHLLEGGSHDSFEAQPDVDNWIAASRATARTRARGFPSGRWVHSDNNEVHHLPGHNHDFLFFCSPLRGSFEMEGEIGAGTTQFLAAGKFFGTGWDREMFQIGNFRGNLAMQTVSPPFSHFDEWIRFRAVFREGQRTIYLNGRPVHKEKLSEHHDPWIGFCSWGRNFAKLRDVRITGSPQIPDVVEMSASPNLAGWISYQHETFGTDDPIWRHAEDAENGGEIRGRRQSGLEGAYCENLLRYHRPLVEDGAIEYEFYYEPGQSHAHPALDRLAFILNPHGVRLHWVTDDRFDRTAVRPENVFDELGNRRGPDHLPLEPGAWNRIKLALAGSTVSLELNGQLIYERELEPTNRRTFGLFHYADQTELRARNVRMKGDWPKSLAPASEQTLADKTVTSLDADLPELASVFTHDFSKNGLPQEYFGQTTTDNRGTVTARPDGVLAVRPGTGRWCSVGIRPRFGAVGDFDIEASFEGYQGQSDKNALIMLRADMDDQPRHQFRMARGWHVQKMLNASLTALKEDGRRAYDNSYAACEAVAGRLRLARRGSKIYYLFAENDSSVFRLLRTDDVSDQPLAPDGIHLRALCNGSGQTRVLWKSVTVRAERLKYLPAQIP